MYRLVIHPFLVKNEEKIDQGIARVRAKCMRSIPAGAVCLKGRGDWHITISDIVSWLALSV